MCSLPGRTVCVKYSTIQHIYKQKIVSVHFVFSAHSCKEENKEEKHWGLITCFKKYLDIVHKLNAMTREEGNRAKNIPGLESTIQHSL